MELSILGLHEAMLVAHVAAVTVGGRQYAVAALAAGQRGVPSDGRSGLAGGLALHWGCAGHEGQGWAPPPPGWHTLPDRSFAAGATSFVVMPSLPPE